MSAGLQEGDRIVAIDDRKIANFEDIVHIVSVSPAKAMTLSVVHDGVTRSVPVVAGSVDDGAGGKLGVLGITGALHPWGRWAPWWTGSRTPTTSPPRRCRASRRSSRGSAARMGWGGPLKIAQLSGQVAQHGVASMISFIALLSVNLGLINLFPIPILDGGHLVFYFIEALRGRPLPPRAQEYGFRAGLALIACLFVFVTWNDLTSFGLFRWVAGLIG